MEQRWDLYIAVLAYPASLDPEEYSKLCIRHFEWCLDNGIHQLLHMCCRMNVSKGEAELFVQDLMEVRPDTHG